MTGRGDKGIEIAEFMITELLERVIRILCSQGLIIKKKEEDKGEDRVKRLSIDQDAIEWWW